MMHENLPWDLNAVELSYTCPFIVVPAVTDLVPARSPLSHWAIYEVKPMNIPQEPIQISKLRFQELLLSISTQPTDCSFSCLLNMLSVLICNAAGALLVSQASIGMGDVPNRTFLAWLLI